jgi:hypothetical protein
MDNIESLDQVIAKSLENNDIYLSDNKTSSLESSVSDTTPVKPSKKIVEKFNKNPMPYSSSKPFEQPLKAKEIKKKHHKHKHHKKSKLDKIKVLELPSKFLSLTEIKLGVAVVLFYYLLSNSYVLNLTNSLVKSEDNDYKGYLLRGAILFLLYLLASNLLKKKLLSNYL